MLGEDRLESLKTVLGEDGLELPVGPQGLVSNTAPLVFSDPSQDLSPYVL